MPGQSPIAPRDRRSITMEIKPEQADFCGAKIETTPVGSSTLKLKCELATGFTLLKIC